MHPVARGLSRASIHNPLNVQLPYGLKAVPPVRHIAFRPLPLTSSSSFSTNALRLQNLEKKAGASNSAPRESDAVNPEYPAFSLVGLGIPKNIRILIYVLLGIFGTMETWVYTKWIWRWWKNRRSEPVD